MLLSLDKIKILVTLGISCYGLIACHNQHQEKTEKIVSPNKTQSNIDTSKPKAILSPIDTNKVEIVQLPRPNSGTFSFEEAENRKGEIYDMQLSVKHFDWENPTSGGALHINQNDEIEVYQFTMGLMYLGTGLDENGDSVVYVDQAPKDTSFVIDAQDIKYHVGGIGLGNPASVLITSEFDLKKSNALEMILEEVFEPGTQIYYLKEK
ncbi:MAG: hypothetical protein MI810_07950 [Flavobacteriales bacterium]|nr:hypothetical protein [Flavobacteriales bacterium]